MRIGFDAKRAFHNATGLGNYSRDVLRVLGRHRPQNSYFAYNPRPGRIPFEPEGAPLVVRGPRRILHRAFPSLWRTSGIVRDLREDGIDVYHGLSAELPLGIERSGIASVVTVADLIFERMPDLYSPIDRRIYSAKARSAARRAGLILTISDQTRRDVIELYGVPESRIRTVYLTFNDVFRTPVPEETLREVAARFSLPAGFVIAVGTIERRKNLLLALRALEKMPDVTLVAVGRPTPYVEELTSFVRSRGLSGRVRLLSGVSTPDLAALYRLAAAAVYPSLYEGFGIPIVEALASGTPVVTTRGGCFEEAGGPGSAYVDPHDPEELRSALSSILGDPARRAAMREAGLVHAERFSGEAIASALVAAYEDARRGAAG